ncbi:MAG: serine/threonine-protein kinase [Planctomycetota bacterium]|nr:serine/threonine-protein kinase [Planctomycetota bacterium]
MTTRRNDETRQEAVRPRPASDQELLDQLADDYLRRLRSGERPSLRDYTAIYPELESEIEEVLSSVAMIEDLKQQSETVGHLPSKKFEEITLERIGDYRIVRELGRGGMGIVLEAIHESLGRRVAIKVLPKQVFDSTSLQRFRKEAQAAAQLHHSNIVNVFGVGEFEGLHYYVMEYVNGQTLADLINQFRQRTEADTVNRGRKPMPTAPNASMPYQGPPISSEPVNVPQFPEAPAKPAAAEAVNPVALPSDPESASPPPLSDLVSSLERPADRFRWSAQTMARIADALEYSQRQQMLHRDIKPGNILIDDQQKPWITDFGLVKEISNQTMTRTGDIFGTPQYMAPESFEGHYDQRSEVYCLGITLYELLATRPAFFDTSPSQLFNRIAKGSPQRLRQINARIPLDLETIVHKAIDRDPDRRYQATGELRDDLERFIVDRPIQARRVRLPERVIRWGRRNPLIASLTCLSTVLLLVVAIVSSFAYVSTSRALTKLDAQHRALEQQQEKTRAAFNRAEANVSISIQAFEALFIKIMTKGVNRDIYANSELESFSELSVLESSVTREDVEILKAAISFYIRFTEQNRENEQLEIEIAKAYRRIANTYHFVGEYGDAEKNYHLAVQAFSEIIKGDPDDIENVVNLAETYNEQALSLRKQNKLRAGLRQYEIAKELLERDRYYDSKICQFTLANTLNSICTFGNRLAGQVARPKSFKSRPIANIREFFQSYRRLRPDYLQKAEEISSKLIGVEPENPDYRLLRAKLYRTRAAAIGVDGKQKWQVGLLRESIQELESLVKDYPQTPSYKFSLALTQMLRIRNISPEEQFELYQDAETNSSELARDYPSVMQYLELLVNIKGIMGKLHENRGEHEKSRNCYETARRALNSLIEKSPDIIDYKFRKMEITEKIADCWVKIGNPAAARVELSGLLRFGQSFTTPTRSRLRKAELTKSAKTKLIGLRLN